MAASCSSTKEDGLPQAKEFAEDWYLELRGKARAGILKAEKAFRGVFSADQVMGVCWC